MVSTSTRIDVRGSERRRTYDPALAIAVLLSGCLLSFYVIGLPLVAMGAWMWVRRRGSD